jgi:hypothetical protein
MRCTIIRDDELLELILIIRIVASELENVERRNMIRDSIFSDGVIDRYGVSNGTKIIFGDR